MRDIIKGEPKQCVNTVPALTISPVLEVSMAKNSLPLLSIFTETGVVTSKECLMCRRVLPLSDYHVNRKGKYGRQARCKPCTHEQFYLPNKQKFLKASQQRRATPEGKARERQWSRDHRRKFRLRRLLQEARIRARNRGLDFDVAESELHLPSVCPVLGIPISVELPFRSDNSPSLDRIDRDKGYVSGNVIVVSWRANRLKSDATLEELRKLVAFYESL